MHAKKNASPPKGIEWSQVESFPHPARFSDPYDDFGGDEARNTIEAIRQKLLPQVTPPDLYWIFNSWLPAGTCEEMAFYLPRLFEVLGLDTPCDYDYELVECLATWCVVEWEALQCYPKLQRFLQQEVERLCWKWLGDTRLTDAQVGFIRPVYSDVVSGFFERLSSLSVPDPVVKRPVFPWLAPEHYLPRLHALGSVQHAAWAMYLEQDSIGRLESLGYADPAPFRMEQATAARAADMVEDWLLASTDQEEIAYWDAVVTQSRMLHPPS